MTQWTPVWSVLIDGVEYRNITLANLTIESGRRDIYQQAVAGYCSLSILNIDDQPVTVAINSGITVFVQNSAATPDALAAAIPLAEAATPAVPALGDVVVRTVPDTAGKSNTVVPAMAGSCNVTEPLVDPCSMMLIIPPI